MTSSDKPFVEEDWAWCLAGIFAFLGVSLSFYNIYNHLSHWNNPVFQLWIVRVLFIIPVYSFISFLSIRFETAGLYMEILRDCYEAFVIYCFLIWILNAIGGAQSCGRSIASRMHMPHPPPLCCLPHIRLNYQFLRVCKQFTLQFVILKPIMGTISFILLAVGGVDLYDNNIWQVIMLTLYNVSYTLALYGLFLFYIATKDEMKAHSPVTKFLAVKSIVFMTYWQSLFVPLVFGSTYADKYDDFILCCEMVVFSYLHYTAFPWWEFKYAAIEVTKDIDYAHTGFSSLDDEVIKNTRVSLAAANNNNNTLRKDNNNNNNNNKYDGIHKSSKKHTNQSYSISSHSSLQNATKTLMLNDETSDMNDPDLPPLDDDNDNTNNINMNENENELFIISDSRCTGNTFFNALCEVISVADVFDDAYRNFKIDENKSSKHLKTKRKEKKREVQLSHGGGDSSYSALNDDVVNGDVDKEDTVRNAEMVGTNSTDRNNSIMSDDMESHGIVSDVVNTMAAHTVMIGQMNTQDIIKNKQAALIPVHTNTDV